MQRDKIISAAEYIKAHSIYGDKTPYYADCDWPVSTMGRMAIISSAEENASIRAVLERCFDEEITEAQCFDIIKGIIKWR